jgi:hypothetical protein
MNQNAESYTILYNSATYMKEFVTNFLILEEYYFLGCDVYSLAEDY